MRAPPEITGFALLGDPRRNKETAFTYEERERLGLVGLLPEALEDIDRQMERVVDHLAQKSTDLERYIYLTSLLDRNETLFYKVLMSDPARLLPIIYAPTVGEACLKFSHIYRRARGMYISLRHRGRIRQVLANWPIPDVRCLCVSTGGRVLGLGDLGADGMGIPIGKLQLYTICAAIPPDALMPVLLDCGTDNPRLIDDPLYVGLREARPTDDVLDAFVDEFMEAVGEVFPRCCVHFEDWKGADALRLLAKYRDRALCYNDDIQGTAGVVLAGLISALRITGRAMRDQRVLLLGAGAAAIGIADLIASAMIADGLSPDMARARIALFDLGGLVEPSRTNLTPQQASYACDRAPSTDLVEAIRSLRPTALIGVSTKGGAFTRAVVDAMSALNERPIIFALSNPTSQAECTAEQAYGWSEGRAIYAAGVQFSDVHIGGRRFVPSQANNMYIFPAVSLAVYATQARRITDDVFMAAAVAVAEQVPEEARRVGMLFPPQRDILETEIRAAIAVAERIFDASLAQVDRPADLAGWIRGQLYAPAYQNAIQARR